jgi:hypothetical protein
MTNHRQLLMNTVAFMAMLFCGEVVVLGSEAGKGQGEGLDGERKFWAFRPVGDPEVPKVDGDAGAVATPIDAFVIEQLKEKGIRPAPPADRQNLIRRATYDLIGLPPTVSEVEAFASDTATNAFEKVIDRLLVSKHYGVRWGRHWLDVARYADSNGLDENLAYGHAWRYRDYVIDSFNQGKPFDRFVIEQIAGDLLPGANQETITATGFLALGAKVLAEKDTEKLFMDVVDEQIDTVSKAFLGMTISCARCHDHKFDPVSQQDYFGLAAIFKSTKTVFEKTGTIKYWTEHSFASEGETERLKKVNAEVGRRKKAATDFQSKETVRIRGAARAQATEYLIAATRFEPNASLEVVARVAQPFGLHSRILHHCRLHLEYHQDDAFFGEWHRLAGDTNAIERHYRPLFEDAQKAFKAVYRSDPKKKALDDPRLAPAHSALYDKSGFLAVPPIPALAFDAGKLAELRRLEEVARVYESAAPDQSAAMGVADGKVLTTMALHIRGDHNSPGKPVKREFPKVLRWSSARPILPDGQSGRLELGRWIGDTRNPLTARVFVNRVWRWHFGRGLVETTENFGRLGDRPSHPKLLDWLAREFMRSGWDVKQLHKLIMNSAVYQRSTQHPHEEIAVAADPVNELWWRFDLRRLEAEQIRDSILLVSGLLDETMGGKTIPLRNRQFVFNHTSQDHTGYEQRRRRAAYLPVVRNHLCEVFQQFDYPDPATPTGNRNTTVVAPQALLMMNSPLVLDAAEALADRLSVGDPAAQVDRAYQLVFARVPTEVERQRAVGFISGSTGEPRQVWALFCQSLLASNEFMFLN